MLVRIQLKKHKYFIDSLDVNQHVFSYYSEFFSTTAEVIFQYSRFLMTFVKLGCKREESINIKEVFTYKTI